MACPKITVHNFKSLKDNLIDGSMDSTESVNGSPENSSNESVNRSVEGNESKDKSFGQKVRFIRKKVSRVTVTCPNCNSNIKPKVRSIPCPACCWCCLMTLGFCFCFAWIPFFIPSCYTHEMFCPECEENFEFDDSTNFIILQDLAPESSE